MENEKKEIRLDNFEIVHIFKALSNFEPREVENVFENGIYGYCPRCRKLCSIGEKYCCECGQHLMWGNPYQE